MVVFNDMTDIEYHSRPELSSTGARRLLDSPARYRYWADHQEPTRAVFDLGTAAHTKILGTGAGTIIYPEQHLTPSGNVSTKAATVEWEKEQRNAGLIPISRFDAGRVDAMAEAVLADAPRGPQVEEHQVRRGADRDPRPLEVEDPGGAGRHTLEQRREVDEPRFHE